MKPRGRIFFLLAKNYTNYETFEKAFDLKKGMDGTKGQNRNHAPPHPHPHPPCDRLSYSSVHYDVKMIPLSSSGLHGHYLSRILMH